MIVKINGFIIGKLSNDDMKSAELWKGGFV